MTTKATRDVIDMAIRPVQNFILDGTGTSSIDGTPIGVTTPDVGYFTNLFATNLTVTGLTTFTGATVVGLQSYYADLAEYYEADADLPPGTVVKIGGPKEITATDTEYDTDVFGVVSTAPAFVMNQSDQDTGFHLPIALVGRVPCRVVGPVTKGCRLYALPGGLASAMPVYSSAAGLSFARSLVDDDQPGERLIEVAIVTVK